jgi:hypothetical protein
METRVGRPPLGFIQTGIRLSPKIIARIRKVNSSISDFIREAIEAHLKKLEKKAKKKKD